MAEKVGEIYYSVSLDTREMIDGQRKIDRELKNTSSSLDGFGAKLTQVAAAVGAYASALYLIRQSDAFTKLNAQLKLATDSSRELAVAQADVRRIAKEAQTDISGVATLYARITTATKELGTSQAQVEAITRTVALALKVSGATAQESASATLQLAQAFASGVLRGEEFNAVNEAAPRLMQALADGIGVPKGELRAMAEAGLLTSEVLAKALPKALGALEEESKKVETISGAFQNLRTEVMLFIGEQTTANGAVKLVAGSIGLLTDNLGLLAGVLATVAAVKFAVWLQSLVAQSYAAVSANRALMASNLAGAQAQAAATAATLTLTTARVAELRQAVLAAEGNVALAVTTNGLIPAQARAAAAAQAHTASLAALTTAQRAASITSGAATAAMGLLGGPIGAITLLLGLGATAWATWGSSTEKANNQAAESTETSTQEIIEKLDRQIAKLKERNKLASDGLADIAKSGGETAEKIASLGKQIADLQAGKGINGGAPLPEAARVGLLQTLLAQYGTLIGKVRELNAEEDIASGNTKKAKAAEWAAKYATDLERVNAEVAKAKKELGDAFTPELEQRIRAKIMPAKKGSGAEKSKGREFDTEGYFANLEAANASALGRIDIAEQEAIRKNDERMINGELSYEEHQYARTLILADAVAERQRIMEADRQKEIADDQRQAEQKARAESQRKSNQDVAKREIAATNPIDAIRFEEEQKIAVIEQYRLQDLANTQLYEDAKKAIHEKAAKDIKAVQDANMVAQLQGYGQLFGGIADITKTFAGEQSGVYQAMFAASKAFAMADAIIKIQQAMASASMSLPFPGNLGAMATVAAQTAGIVSTISSTNYGGGRQYGGPVSSGSMYRVNETGAPEMFTANNGNQYMLPTKSGSVTSADKVGGGGISVVVNVDASGSSVEGDGAQSKQLGAMIGNAVRAVLIQEKRNGGLLA